MVLVGQILSILEYPEKHSIPAEYNITLEPHDLIFYNFLNEFCRFLHRCLTEKYENQSKPL